MLPDLVQERLEALLKEVPLLELQTAATLLSQTYRENKNSAHILDHQLMPLAYLAVRLPATFAMLTQVLEKLPFEKDSSFSLLDVGAGPATVWGALNALGVTPHQATLYEQDASFKELAGHLWPDMLKASTWQGGAISHHTLFPTADLVTLGFVLGEFPQEAQADLLSKAWQATAQYLVIVEPGTPQRFDWLKKARQQLIEEGAHILAPCTHSQACPMAKGDWCHFSTTIDRSLFHRRIKQVSHPLELEKYSYLIASRKKIETAPNAGRLVRLPLKRAGHIAMDVCTAKGLQRVIVSKKNKDTYKTAKSKKWGDEW